MFQLVTSRSSEPVNVGGSNEGVLGWVVVDKVQANSADLEIVSAASPGYWYVLMFKFKKFKF